VIGVDRSQPQLDAIAKAYGKPLPSNLTFSKGEALALPAASGSVDLATMAQMFHWLPFTEGLVEAKRVLKPRTGVLGIVSYAMPRIANDATKAAQKALDEYYFGLLGSDRAPGTAGCLWDVDRRRVDSGYAGEDFTSVFPRVERFSVTHDVASTVGSFLSYMATQSAYQNALVTMADPLAGLKQALGADDASRPLATTLTFHVLLCRM